MVLERKSPVQDHWWEILPSAILLQIFHVCSICIIRPQSTLVIATCDMYYLFALCLLGIAAALQPAAPHHSADQLPDTVFSCRDKVLGGYYADPDAQCQMFHVCVKVAGVGIQDFRFLCPNGTAFDQEAQICAGWADVACEPAALYYSSDNFDLYRIGSGFESKKAPVNFEDEPDFHLQRSEPDIFSGAHSSNFFNNREGKDSQDAADVGGQKKNQVDQQPRKKIVKKLQRRPTESSSQSTSSVQPRQFTNNFAGSYVPTTARPTSTTNIRSTSPPQYNNNNNYYQRTNNQSYRQPSSTVTTEQETKVTQRTEQVVQNSTPSSRYNNRGFRSRTQSTPESNYNLEADQLKNKQTTSADIKNNYSQYSKDSKSSFDNNAYNSGTSNNYNANQPTTSRYNTIDRKQTYENQQTTTKINYNTELNVRYDQKQSSPQYNNNNNQQNFAGNYEQTTSNIYNGETDKNAYNKQDSTYYSSKSTQQTTPQYQQYNNQQSTTQYNYNNEEFEKIKPTTKFTEKKQQFNVNKQSTPQYNYNSDDQKFNQPQTPKPKYNTNLQYDNNQQSTPLYTFNTEKNLQFKNNQPSASTYQQQQFSTSTPVSNLRGGNYNNQQFQQKSTNDYQQTSTSDVYQQGNGQKSSPLSNQYSNNQQQTSTSDVYQQGNGQKSSPLSNQYSNNQQQTSNSDLYQQGNIQKSSPINNQYSTARPSTSNVNNNQYSTVRSSGNVNSNRQYEQRSTSAPFRQNKPNDYDDGQYRPELYEREAGGQYDTTVRQSNRNNTPAPKAPEPELLKTAHSINIAASGNQLARQNKQQSSPAPVTTQKILYTQAAQTVYTTTSPKSVYSSFAAVTSAAPRPFSARPVVQVSSSVSPPKVLQVKQVKQAPIQQKQKPNSDVAKSGSSKKSKDVSYDYAYYDNSDHYSEYENIEEFGRTSKKQ